jgi:hypothetical protein
MFDPEEITYFGETDSRGKRVRFGIKAEDRSKHMYVIGKSGMGKSTLLENMAVQDIQNGNGFCFLDPHGGSAELLMAYIPEERKKDVLYIAPFDTENPIGFNILENIGADKRHLVVSGIMSVFKKLWADQWSARMEYFLQNTLFALLEYPGATLLHVNRMYSDKAFRDEVISHITDPAILDFWTNEWASMTERFIAEATPAIQNKIGQFAANPVLRNILGQPKSTFDFRELMDERKIVIVNLAKGLIGEANADLIGSMIVTKLYLAAMSRADVGKFEMDNLPNFYLYVDEFQSFSNESFANILSEARKYKLNLTIAHQYVEQMEETVAAAVFGNVGTTVTFRVGATDADALEKEFAPVFEAADLVNLGKYQVYLKLMIEGVGSVPFSATTMPPLPRPQIDLTDEVVGLSREKYSTSKSLVEKNMQETVFFDFKKKNENKKGGGGKGGQNNNGQNKGGNQNSNAGQNNSAGQGKSAGSNNNGSSASAARPNPPLKNSQSAKPQQTHQRSEKTDAKNQVERPSPKAPVTSRVNTPRVTNDVKTSEKSLPKRNEGASGNISKEKPEPPPLSETVQEGNHFKVALKHESFAKSMKKNVANDGKRENQSQRTSQQKSYNKDKGTAPERRTTLQEALAALKPQKVAGSSEQTYKREKDSSQKTQEREVSRDLSNNKEEKTSSNKNTEKEEGGGSERQRHQDKNQSTVNSTNYQKDFEKTERKGHSSQQKEPNRTVKIPAHISDDQLQKLLKITEKDLELNT